MPQTDSLRYWRARRCTERCEYMQDPEFRLPHHIHKVSIDGEEREFIHVDASDMPCERFIRWQTERPRPGRLCHFLSKRQHEIHRVTAARIEIGRHLHGGVAVHPETGERHSDALTRHERDEAAAREMPEVFLCGHCGETFEPKPWPDNEHIVMFLSGVTLPGGRHLKPDADPVNPNRTLEAPVAVCPDCCAKTRLVEKIEHDWNAHDHRAKPLVK